MTKGFGEYFLTLNFRNGVGFDLEFTDSRAVWISVADSDEISASSFEGVVILAPFLILTFGKLWMED